MINEVLISLDVTCEPWVEASALFCPLFCLLVVRLIGFHLEQKVVRGADESGYSASAHVQLHSGQKISKKVQVHMTLVVVGDNSNGSTHLVLPRVIYDRVLNEKNYFEIPAFFMFE